MHTGNSFCHHVRVILTKTPDNTARHNWQQSHNLKYKAWNPRIGSRVELGPGTEEAAWAIIKATEDLLPCCLIFATVEARGTSMYVFCSSHMWVWHAKKSGGYCPVYRTVWSQDLGCRLLFVVTSFLLNTLDILGPWALTPKIMGHDWSSAW